MAKFSNKRRHIPVVKTEQTPRWRSPNVLAFLAGFAVAAGLLYSHFNAHPNINVVPTAQPSKNSDLLTGYDWSHFAGAEQLSDGVQISPLGRAIVNQDGSPNQTNPPVNLDGPHLQVFGDFSVTAEVASFDSGDSLQLYDKPPLIYDEWRYEPPSVRISSSKQALAIDMWDGRADTAELHRVFKYNVSVQQLTIARIGKRIVLAANGNQQLGSVPDNVFKDGEVWFGGDAALNTSGWQLKALAASAVNGGNVEVVASPDLTAAHNDPSALRNLAAHQSRPLNIGAAVALSPLLTDSAYRNLAIGQYDMWTPENEMKAQFIHPQPDVYSFKEADLLVNTALANDIKVHGHTLVFGEANPAWMQNAPPSQLQQIMVDHIKTVVGHFKGRVAEWDITDELLNDDGTGFRDTIWYRAMGSKVVPIAFQAAHEADPNALLCDNEYGMENSPDELQFEIDNVVKPGIPAGLNCVGFEAHVYNPSTDSFTAAQLEQRMQQLAGLGIKSRVAELDVSGDDITTQTNQYNEALTACLAVPTCIDFSTWGFTDKYGSTTGLHEYPLSYGDALPFDENLQPKPAYTTLQRLLQQSAQQ